MTPQMQAMSEAMRVAFEAVTPKPKPKRDLSRPTVYAVDQNGEMQPTDILLGGYTDLDDYMTCYNEHEEREARLREIKELLESGRPGAESLSISDVLKTIIRLCEIEG